MSAYRGYLLKFGSSILPNDYLAYGNYKCTPYQRTEIETYRDDYTQELFRLTSLGLKTKIDAQIRRMWLKDKIKVQNLLKSGLVDKLQRKYEVEYWNDEDNDYITGYFYIPDTTFSILWAPRNDLLYDFLRLALIEY